MASTHTVEQLLALDTAGLIEYLKANGCSQTTWNLNFDLRNVTDYDHGQLAAWDGISENQHVKLRQRVTEALYLIQEPRLETRFPQLVAKLDIVKAGRDAWGESPRLMTRTRRRSRTPSPLWMWQPGAGDEHEIRCYHRLVADGGRPPCSPETFRQMYKSPADYHELLAPWLPIPVPPRVDEWHVFSVPLERWQEFRRWQRNNRGNSTSTADESLAAFRKGKWLELESRERTMTAWAVGFEEWTREQWQAEVSADRWLREDKVGEDGSFTEYVEAARRRLVQHGFHEPFQLLEDPQQQDERVTWIEYLAFESWWLDWKTNTLQRREPSYYAAWPDLVQSKVLRADETEADVLALPPSLAYHQPTDDARENAIQLFKRQTDEYKIVKQIHSRQSRLFQWAWSQVQKRHTAAPSPAGSTERRRLQEDGEARAGVKQRPATKKQKKKKKMKMKKSMTKQKRRPDESAVSSTRTKARAAQRPRKTRITAGLLSLPGLAWELTEEKRRSIRTQDAQERRQGATKPLGSLRERLP